MANNESIKAPLPRQGTNLTNSSSESYGQMLVVPLGRQKTGDTFNGPNIGSSGTLFTFDDNDRDGEPQDEHPQMGGYGVQNGVYPQMRRRRTFWGDLCGAIKRYCCCCLFGGCCCRNECCEEWIWYCCGCCCGDSYLNEEYEADARHLGYVLNRSGAGGSGGTMSSSYSNYHIDLNNTEYKIIHEDGCGGSDAIAVPQNGGGREDLKHSLLRHHASNYSMDGVGAECMKSSMDQADPHQFTMRSDECH